MSIITILYGQRQTPFTLKQAQGANKVVTNCRVGSILTNKSECLEVKLAFGS